MELVAMDMKLRGMYIARQLSFHGVTFRVAEIEISDRYKIIYNDSVKLVSFLKYLFLSLPLSPSLSLYLSPFLYI